MSTEISILTRDYRGHLGKEYKGIGKEKFYEDLKLVYCPFCHSTDTWFDDSEMHHGEYITNNVDVAVRCQNCGTHGPRVRKDRYKKEWKARRKAAVLWNDWIESWG